MHFKSSYPYQNDNILDKVKSETIQVLVHTLQRLLQTPESFCFSPIVHVHKSSVVCLFVFLTTHTSSIKLYTLLS